MQSLIVPQPLRGAGESSAATGADDAAGVLLAWHVLDGDEAEEGQLVAEVEFGSEVVEVTASRWGVVRQVVPVGGEVRAGEEVGGLDD